MCPTQTEAELAVLAKPPRAYQPFPCRAQIYNPMGLARMATVGCAQGRKEGGLQSLKGLASSMQCSTHLPHDPVWGVQNTRTAGKGKAVAYEAQNGAGRFNGELGEPKP